MFYSDVTDTILVSDWVGGRVFERSPSGALVQRLSAPVS